MKAGTVQIAWHASEPVLSIEFHPTTGVLATAGADRDIKLWTVQHSDNPKVLPKVTFEASLSYHSTAVNVIRFSPSGEELASGADGGEIFLWRLVLNKDNVSTWKVFRTLRFHPKDVLDLAWSPDGSCLASASVDNTCIIWDVAKGSPQQILTDHLHYVQGVAWDPTGQYIASMSADRTCRIYSCKSHKGKNQEKRYVCQHALVKAESAAGPTSGETSKATKHHLFFDETMPSFFRRLAWSPDGSFLLLPAGIHKVDSTSLCAAYAFSRSELSKPVFTFPGMCKAVVAVRFCPLRFAPLKLDGKNEENTAFNLPYRLVYAIATLNSVSIYDTQQLQPIAFLGAIHYAAITDLAWSPDAKFLVISSTDGYCTVAEFSVTDLGIPFSAKVADSQVPQRRPDEETSPCPPRNEAKPEEGLVTNVESVDRTPEAQTARPSKSRRITPVFVEEVSHLPDEPTIREIKE